MTQGMGIDLQALALSYKPAHLGIHELRMGNDWRAYWIEADELPPDAPVLYSYAVVVAEDKGYVTRRAGERIWSTVEGARRADEAPEGCVKRMAAEQAGVVTAAVRLIGFYECRATTHNPDFPAGTVTVRPIYLVVAKKLSEMGKDALFERRRLPMNEHARALRERYPELNESIVRTVDQYAVLKARGTL